MDDDAPTPDEPATYRIGEGLYGLSLHELEARIAAYGAEIARLEAEKEKKSRERLAADQLFSKN
ncbi:MAG: DUF1192 domain-containing protein [Litorimonas sp.]